MVPLVGENRSLVRRGLAEMRRAQRPGMRALIAAANCEPTRLDEGDLAFRLAPRINAAGRLYRADAGVELLLTEDEERAEAIAAELEPRQLRSGGRPSARSTPPPRRRGASCREHLREAPALVLAGEGWHPGRGRDRRLAAGRAPPPAGGRDLARRRGRRARLGAQHPRLRPARRRSRPARSTWSASAGTGPPPGWSSRPRTSTPSARPSPPTRPRCSARRICARTERIDAMVGGVGLGLELAEELEQLAPFGMGNPGVRLLVPSARVSDVRHDGGGQARPLQPPQRLPTARSASPSAAPASASRTTTRSTPRCGSRSTTGTARSSRASSCASSTRSTRRGRRAGRARTPATARTRSGGGASRPS